MAVEADLSSSLTEIVIEVVTLIISAIKIIEELVVFIRYKASKLEVFGVTIAITIAVAVAVTGRVGKGIEIIKQ